MEKGSHEREAGDDASSKQSDFNQPIGEIDIHAEQKREAAEPGNGGGEILLLRGLNGWR